jgi:hypothetical protein
MKYTIEGFSQKILVDKGLDAVDAVILRWFVDFHVSGKMKRLVQGDKVYHWVHYQSVIDDLPCIGVTNKESLGRRFQKLVKAEVLSMVIYTVGGKFSYFAINPDGYAPLVDTLSTQKSIAIDSKVDTLSTQKSGLIDSSIKDSSIRFPQDSQPLILATLLMTEHKKTDEKYTVTPATLQKWAKDIERLIRIDDRTPEEVRSVIEWCQSPGCFWVPNILSGAKLREKFPTLVLQAKGDRNSTPLFDESTEGRMDMTEMDKRMLRLAQRG